MYKDKRIPYTVDYLLDGSNCRSRLLVTTSDSRYHMHIDMPMYTAKKNALGHSRAVSQPPSPDLPATRLPPRDPKRKRTTNFTKIHDRCNTCTEKTRQIV